MDLNTHQHHKDSDVYRYVFLLLVYFALPKDLYDRWTRQIATPYIELSEQEKESDRKEAKVTIKALNKEGFEII